MGLGMGLLLGLGRGLPSAIDTYRKGRAFDAAQEEARLEREERAAAAEERRRERDQAFQLDQRRLNASVTEMGNKQRQDAALRSSREAMLQGLATSDRGELGDALRAASMAGGGPKAFRDMDPDELARLAALSARETPEERQARELANIEARERMQQQYSERLVRAASGTGTERQTPDQMAAREALRGAETNARGAERDFRRVLGRRPVLTKFQDRLTMQPDTAAYNAALDAFREDSADAAQVRDDAREDVQAAERVRDQLFPTFGRTAATAAPPPQAPQPQQALGSTIGGRPTLSLSREERVQYAEREYDALVAAGIARSVAGRSVAAKYGIQIIDQP